MASSIKFTDDKSVVTERFMKSMKSISGKVVDLKDIAYSHASLCQVYFPYNDLGSDLYEVSQGNLTMRVNGARYLDPETKKTISRGIPYGTRARLLLYHINELAITQQSRELRLASSITDLAKKMRLPTSGRTINELKKQLERLCTASISLQWNDDQATGLSNFFVIEEIYTRKPLKGMNYAKTGPEKGFNIVLSEKYFRSVIKSGVPLDKRAVMGLQNNSMCLDIYCWLAHRLFRIAEGKSSFVSWKNMKDQFGSNFAAMNTFKRDFRKNLKNVEFQYPEAKFEEVRNKGFILHRSPPPIPQQLTFPGIG